MANTTFQISPEQTLFYMPALRYQVYAERRKNRGQKITTEVIKEWEERLSERSVGSLGRVAVCAEGTYISDPLNPRPDRTEGIIHDEGMFDRYVVLPNEREFSDIDTQLGFALQCQSRFPQFPKGYTVFVPIADADIRIKTSY